MADRIFTNDGVLISKVMRDLIASWPRIPVKLLMEDPGREGPCMVLQQLSAAEVLKTYVNGSYIGVWNFAVYVRINAEDTATRFDAVSILEELGAWMSEKDSYGRYKNLPVIDEIRVATKIEMTNTPSIANRGDDGVEDYQALFSLEYKARR